MTPTESAESDYVTSRMKLCEERIGYRFRDQQLLRQCLMHSSRATIRSDCNERLEFLGDAILGMVICRQLFEEYPDQREGQLTQQKSRIVSRTTCARVAQELGGNDLILVGRGLQGIPESIAAALVESIIAGIYLDGGLEAAGEFIGRAFAFELERTSGGDPENFKSVLQEETQRVHNEAPKYVLIEHRGPDHAREYCVAAEIGETQYESAWGRSKKDAEQKAALNALKKINPGIIPSVDDGRQPRS